MDEIDTKHFPIELFRKYSKDLYDTNHLNQLRRGHFQGELHLRFQLAFYLFTNRGVICDPNQIIIGSSTEQLVNQLVDLLLYFNVYYRKPSYPPIKNILDKNKLNMNKLKLKIME